MDEQLATSMKVKNEKKTLDEWNIPIMDEKCFKK